MKRIFVMIMVTSLFLSLGFSVPVEAGNKQKRKKTKNGWVVSKKKNKSSKSWNSKKIKCPTGIQAKRKKRITLWSKFKVAIHGAGSNFGARRMSCPVYGSNLNGELPRPRQPVATSLDSCPTYD